jgi:NifB/MoaA-like Fe-S oxidoreductase
VQEIENLATQLWSQLENAGIDPGSHLRFTPIERQPYTSPTPQIDPQMEELTKKLLQTDDDLEQLMAEILEDTMEVEMAASKEELEKAKEEIEHLKGELRRWK